MNSFDTILKRREVLESWLLVGFFFSPKESLPTSSRMVHPGVQENLQRWQEGLHG